MEQDIRESKEYRLAKEWEMAVNSYAFNPAATTTATVRRTRRRNESWNISKRTEDTFH